MNKSRAKAKKRKSTLPDFNQKFVVNASFDEMMDAALNTPATPGKKKKKAA